jgi:septum formation protein
MSNVPLILASTSKYRAQLLQQLGVPFETRAISVNETPFANESPRANCLRLSIEKARAGVRTTRELIIGSDQVLDLDGEAVSKPGTFDVARQQLMRARGRTLTCYTAVALLNTATGTIQSDVVSTEIQYRDMSDIEIERYLQIEKPFDCAGALKVEARGIALLKRVTSDDPSALIGLPLIQLTDFLRAENFPI